MVLDVMAETTGGQLTVAGEIRRHRYYEITAESSSEV